MLPTDTRLMLLTIGFGDREKPEETLYGPLRKTVTDGNFTSVIFLPSKMTVAAPQSWSELYAAWDRPDYVAAH